MPGLDRSARILLRPARWQLVGVVSAGVAQSLFVIAQAFVVAGLITSLVRRDESRMWVVALALVVVMRGVAGWVGDVSAAAAAGRAGRALRSSVLQRTLDAGPEWRASRRTGELAALATRGVSAVEPYLTRYLPALVLAAVLPVLTLVAIATQDLLSALIIALTLPLLPVFAALVGWATQKRAAQQWREMAALAGHFVDVVQGLPTLVAFRRADAQAESIRRVTDRYRRATLRTLRLAFASAAVLEMVATLSVALVAVAVGLRLASGDLDLRTALVALLLAPEAYWPIRRVGAEFHAAAEGGATLAEIAALPAARTHPDKLEQRLLPSVGRIELREASVTYPDRQNPALTTGMLTLDAGGLTAITGPSGAGKSTLLSVIRGVLPLSSGQLLVDDVPLHEIDPDWWQAQIGWLPQRPWFAASSVADNVRLGRQEATDVEVWRALTQVGLDEVVASRGGLTAHVGEDGRHFSAGERARLALARVVVSRRPLVLLDEPTAHLDAATEAVILETLRVLAETTSVLVVAHRQAVVDVADRVVEIVAPTPVRANLPQATTWAASPRDPERRASAGEAVEPPGRRRRLRSRLLLGVVLGCLSSVSGVALTATAGWLIVRASEHPQALGLLVAIIGVRTFGIARPGLRYGERLVSHDAALRELAERRAAVYDSLVPLTPGALGPRRGDLLASVVDDVDAYVDRQLRVRQPVWTAIGVTLVAVGVAALVLPMAGVVLGLMLTAGSLAAWWLARYGARRQEPRFVAARAASYDEVTEALAGAEDLESWGASQWAIRRLDVAGRALATAAVRSAIWVASGRAVMQMMSGFALVTLALLAPTALADGRVGAPMLALVAFLPLALAEVLTPVADAAVLAVRAEQSLNRLAVLRNRKPVVTDPAHAVDVPVPPGAMQVCDASVAWGEVTVLQDLSLNLPRGGRLAVVGPTGCGKSTLAGLLVRFIDPGTGSVRLSGVDLRALLLDDVRRSVGLVDDDPHIFGSTLVENIRFARPAASDTEVETALRTAHLGDWLDGLPAGLDTWLGGGGGAVSGGERARIGLARVLMSDNPVVVLDEPTAHLDAATAQAVTNDLLSGVGTRSVVMMTHRPEGLDLVDAVLELSSPMPHPVELLRA